MLNKEDLFNFELMDNSYQYITSSKAEAALDTAIVKVTSDRNDKFVILTDNTGDTETGYTYLSKLLGANNYNVITMEIEKGDIPDEVNTVVAYSPTKDYSEAAVKKLESFLYNGGNYGKSLIYISYRNKIESPNIDKLLNTAK